MYDYDLPQFVSQSTLDREEWERELIIRKEQERQAYQNYINSPQYKQDQITKAYKHPIGPNPYQSFEDFINEVYGIQL